MQGYTEILQGYATWMETAPEELARECDVVFTSLPHAASAATVERLVDAGVRVIDMSADFRYKDPEVYRQWYKVEPAKPELMAQAVYGLPEYYREDIRRASDPQPGCFVTSAILALAPLLSAGLIEEQGLIVDAKSGTTGAGRTPSQAQHFSEVDESFKAYNVDPSTAIPARSSRSCHWRPGNRWFCSLPPTCCR